MCKHSLGSNYQLPAADNLNYNEIKQDECCDIISKTIIRQNSFDVKSYFKHDVQPRVNDYFYRCFVCNLKLNVNTQNLCNEICVDDQWVMTCNKCWKFSIIKAKNYRYDFMSKMLYVYKVFKTQFVDCLPEVGNIIIHYMFQLEFV